MAKPFEWVIGVLVGGFAAGRYLIWQTREQARHELRSVVLKIGAHFYLDAWTQAPKVTARNLGRFIWMRRFQPLTGAVLSARFGRERKWIRHGRSFRAYPQIELDLNDSPTRL